MSATFRIGVVAASASLAQRFVACQIEAAIREETVHDLIGLVEVEPASPCFTRDDRIARVFMQTGLADAGGGKAADPPTSRGDVFPSISEEMEEQPVEGQEGGASPTDESPILVKLTPARQAAGSGLQIGNAASRPGFWQRVFDWTFPDAAAQMVAQRAQNESPRRFEFHCLGLGRNDAEITVNLTRLRDLGDLDVLVLYHRLTHDRQIEGGPPTLVKMAEQLMQCLPTASAARRPVRLVVVLDDALLPASFLSMATSEAERLTMAEAAKAAGDEVDPEGRFVSPFEIVEGEAYRQHVLDRYLADPNLKPVLQSLSRGLAGARHANALPPPMALVDGHGRDRKRREIAAICWIPGTQTGPEMVPRYDSTLAFEYHAKRSSLGLADLPRAAVAYAHPLSRWLPYGHAGVWDALVARADSA